MADSQKTTSQRKEKNSRKSDKKSSGQKDSQQKDGQSQGQKEQQKGGQEQQKQQDQQEQKKQEVGWPEWITFGISLVIVLGFVGLQLYLHWQGEEGPPRIFVEADLSGLDQVGSDYYLPVEVTNEGGSTAEDVNVQLTLQGGEGNSETASFVIQFLAPEETVEQIVVFKSDPQQGELSYSVSFKDR